MGSPSPFAFVCFCSRRMFLSENFHSSNGNNIPRNDAMKQFKAIKTVGVILGVYIVLWMDAQSGLIRCSLLLYSDESSL